MLVEGAHPTSPSPAAAGEGRGEGVTSRVTSPASAKNAAQGAAVALAASIGLAVLAQSALLRTHSAVPAVPLFVAACVVGGWAAVRWLPPGQRLVFGRFPTTERGHAWKAVLALAVAAAAGALVLFGRNLAGSAAWALFAAGVVLVGLAFWMLDGRPGLRLNWSTEAPWLIALGVLIAAGAALRLTSLGSIPFGLWYDEAYSALQVQRILRDPAFRPVYVGGFAQEPSLLWYLMAPAFKALGANQFALRLPTAIGGIAGIPAIYLLGRELFGRKTGLIAAALLTTLVWHLTFSRIAFNSEWSVTMDALGLFLLIRALRKGSWTAAALAGISLGLGLNFYYTSRLMILVAGVAVLALWLANRSKSATLWRVLLAAAVAGVFTTSPLIEFAKQHPAEFNSRLQQATVFREVRDAHSLTPVVDNLKAHALMFNVQGDRNARHNLPGQPELNFLLAGLFVLGLGICLARARRPEYALLPVWCAVMLAGGVFSVSFEAPQSLRTIDEINVVVLLCAIPLALLWDACAPFSFRRNRQPAAGEAGATLTVEAWPESAIPSPAGGRGWLVKRELVPSPQPSPAAAEEGASLRRFSDGRLALSRRRERRYRFGWPRAHPVVALLPVWAAAAVWLTDPLYRHFTTAVPAGFDTAQFLWGLWWVKYALLDLHQSPLYTSYLFAPQHMNLAFHTLALLSGLISIPFQLTIGLFGAFNAVLLGSFVACAAGAYLLIEHETGSRAGAFVGSLIFTFAPYKMAHLSAGHLHVVSTWAVPFFVLFLLRWLRSGKLAHAAIAGVFLACTGLTDLNQLLLSLLLGAALVAGFTLQAWMRTAKRLPRELAGIGVIGLVSTALMFPLLTAIVDGLRHGWNTSTPLSAPQGWSPDLLSYMVPLPSHPVWGSFGRTVAERFHFLDPARLVFVGYVALLLALLALLRRRSSVSRWWLVTGVFWLLSLGPLLHVAGQSRFRLAGTDFSIPLPFAAFHALPLIGGLSNPGYFSLIFMLGLAILAGHGVAWLLQAAIYPRLLTAGLGTLVLVESLTVPLPLFGPTPNPVFQRLATEPGRQAMLVAPVGWLTELGGDGTLDGADLYFATVARRPTISGEISRVPDGAIDFYRRMPELSVLLFPDKPPAPESGDARLVTEALHSLDVGYIVIHHWPRYNQQLAYVTQTLHYPSFYEDTGVAAFRVPQ